VGERKTVARGRYDGGLSWLIWAERRPSRDGRPDADLMSMIRITDASGRILREGGASGLALEPGTLMNVSTGGGDEGPYCLLVRVDPQVRRVAVTTEAGQAMNLPVHDAPDFPEVRFAALLVPRDLHLAAVTGFGPDGQLLERFDLTMHQRHWHEHR
jgi:hypothetical protein